VRRPYGSRVAAPVSEREIEALLTTFAGPPKPVARTQPSYGRGAPRRTIFLVAVALLALVVSVPALALHGQLAETISQFLGSKSQPQHAKEVIGGVARGPLQALPLIKGTIRSTGTREEPYTLTRVREVVTASTPQGEIRLYELDFSNGYKGSAMVSVSTHDVGGAAWGPDVPCPPGWALEAGGSMVTLPGRTPLLVSGRVGEAVAAVDVVYPDGHSSEAAVGNGYFLGWVLPVADAPTGRRGFSPPVTLVARGNAGDERGRLSVRSDGDIPPSPGQPAQAVACG
jgi:hypothetical protein